MSSYLPPEPESSSSARDPWGSPPAAADPTLPLPQFPGDSRSGPAVFDAPTGYGSDSYGTPPPAGFAPYLGHPQPAHLSQPMQPPYPGYAPAGYQGMQPYAGQPGYLVSPGFLLGPDAGAPFGRDPYTREPLSDKSKVGAGLLQLFLGTLGVGRFYLGHSGVGAAQLILTILGFATAFIGVGVVLIFAVSVWAFVDAIMMFTGSVRDSRGLKLRS